MAEVRPDEVRTEDIDAFERAVGAEGAEPPRLVGPDGASIQLPPGIHDLLLSIIENLRAGNGVSVIPLHAELTTVEAAKLLNVSRPFLVKQIDAGVIPHHMVGTHRRLRLAQVLEYRDRQDADSAAALALMVREAEELGLYED